MMPSFGFSVGDFIGAISERTSAVMRDRWTHLVQHRSDQEDQQSAQSNRRGIHKFQQAIIELNCLKYVLRQLEALEPTDDNLNHVNAIRDMALACQLPLRDFLTKLEIFEAPLGPFARGSSFRAAHSKTNMLFRWLRG